MNGCNLKFFERNGISVQDVCSKVDCHIYSGMEVNPITATSNFKKEPRNRLVSIADVVGYNTGEQNVISNVFLSMDHFFNENGTPYSLRGIGMLEYDKDNVMEKLMRSFIEEPMVLTETGEGTYTVTNNGLHRYTVLRALYLSEAAKAKGNEEELAKLAEKYTIPVSVIGVDLEKTYCKYLLERTEFEDMDWDILNVSAHYDSNYKRTGHAVVKYGNGKEEVLTGTQLVGLTRERILQDDNFKGHYANLQVLSSKCPSFAKFIHDNFSDLIPLKQKSNERDER